METSNWLDLPRDCPKTAFRQIPALIKAGIIEFSISDEPDIIIGFPTLSMFSSNGHEIRQKIASNFVFNFLSENEKEYLAYSISNSSYFNILSCVPRMMAIKKKYPNTELIYVDFGQSEKKDWFSIFDSPKYYIR